MEKNAKIYIALITLLQLAEKSAEQSALALAKANQQVTSAQEQCEQLEQYRREYLEQHVEMLTSGIESQALVNFRGFLLNLDRTIIGQQEIVAQNKRVAQEQRLIWQESQRKKMSYEVLIEQEKNQLAIAEAKLMTACITCSIIKTVTPELTMP